MKNEVPEVVILRLPLYLRSLDLLREEGMAVISSQELGKRLEVTPAQIRKDLSYFGRFGKQGKGYHVKRLAEELRQILGLDREWNMALVGVGQLGRAILRYAGFARRGFTIVAAFDVEPRVVGRKIGQVVVHHIDELETVLSQHPIHIGIVAVPPSQAQKTIQRLASLGVPAILNYAPVVTRAPKGVILRDVDPVLSLESMTYHLKAPAVERAAKES